MTLELPHAMRYKRNDGGAPRLRPSKLSGSTAKLDDSIFLRANVADVRDRSDALGSLSHADLAGQAA